MRMRLLVPAVCLTLLAASSCPVSAQDAEPAPEATAQAPPEPARKPKPKPRPKPQAKRAEKPAEEKAAGTDATARIPNQQNPEPPPPSPSTPAVAPQPLPPAQTLAAAPPVACGPGEAVRYEASPRTGASPAKGPGAAGSPASLELWVTRTGSIAIDNPLRPLTPDVTRVLQVVIGGKVATAYGPDLLSLRRGAGPAVLEGVIGGSIRWDAALASLPDALPILSDSGEVLAEFTFRACGTAPAARTLAAPKPRRTAPPVDAAGLEPETGKEAGKDAKERSRPTRRAEPRPDAAPRPAAVPMPQGAIP